MDLSADTPDVRHLRPIVVHVTQRPDSAPPAPCAECMGDRILRDFGLDPEKVLWIEQDPDSPHRFRVALFRPKGLFGTQTLYAVKWRPIQANERSLLQRFVPEAGRPAV